MPRSLRIVLTGLSFAIFFGGSLALGLALFPLLFVVALGNIKRHRERCTRLIGWGYGTFTLWMKLTKLVQYEPISMPEELRGKPYVLVANHPTYIDLLFLLHYFPGLTCVAKASWYRNLFFGPLLRSTYYIPGPGYIRDQKSDLKSPVLDRMIKHVERGHPLLIFPEGTRSASNRLRRFKRGPFELAKQTGVPIVPVFIRVDRPFLMKGVPFWDVPPKRATFEFEILPLIDTKTDARSGRELRDDLQADFEKRFEAWLRTREHFEIWSSSAEIEPS